jgi:abortive infection bacteriophage resistance protein
MAVANAFNPSTWKEETGGSPSSQPGLYTETLSQQNKTKQNKTKQNKTKQNKTKQNKTTTLPIWHLCSSHF